MALATGAAEFCLPYATGVFVGGRAEATVFAFAFDEDEDDFAFAEETATVRPRPSRG
jgi:hypothetical protein